MDVGLGFLSTTKMNRAFRPSRLSFNQLGI